MLVLHLQGLRYQWRPQSTEALAFADLQLNAKEHLLIRGSSGSGKTTLLNILAGILLPTQGEVRVLGQALPAMTAAARDRFRADHLGIIFQQFNLLPYLSVIDNIQLPCHFSARRRQQAGHLPERTRELLAHLQLPENVCQRPVTELSVGQQQRVAVARALMGNPELILADEPTSALDTLNRDSLIELLLQEAQAQGSTLIMVSHDPAFSQMFKRVIDLPHLSTLPTASQEVIA